MSFPTRAVGLGKYDDVKYILRSSLLTSLYGRRKFEGKWINELNTHAERLNKYLSIPYEYTFDRSTRFLWEGVSLFFNNLFYFIFVKI